MTNHRLLHPFARIFISTSLTLLLIFPLKISVLSVFCALIILNLLLENRLSSYFKVLIVFGIPFLLMLILVIFYLNPENLIIDERIEKIAITFIRVFGFSGIFQFAFNIRVIPLIDVLRYIPVGRTNKIILLESIYGIRQSVSQVERILTARISRGFLKKRSVKNLIFQFPFLIRPLLATFISSSIEKSYNWQQQNLLSEFKSQLSNSSLLGSYNSRYSILISSLHCSTILTTILFEI